MYYVYYDKDINILLVIFKTLYMPQHLKFTVNRTFYIIINRADINLILLYVLYLILLYVLYSSSYEIHPIFNIYDLSFMHISKLIINIFMILNFIN